MRKPDKTLIFGSPPSSHERPPVAAAPVGPSGTAYFPAVAPSRAPVSQQAPVSMNAPVSRNYEKQWFNEPPPLSVEPPMTPIGDDLLAESRGFLPRSPERGLAFAAVALALLGIAGAGTYFFFGLENTAHQEETSTTTVTNAEVPATPAATTAATPTSTPTPAPAATPADLSWTPPVVDAVKSPDLAPQITSPQVAPTGRAAAQPTKAKGNANANATATTAPLAKPAAAKPAQADDQQTAEGFYPGYTPSPGDTTVTPPPTQETPPSAGDREVTTHIEPEETDNTMHNPSGEPALPQTLKQ